MANYVGNVRDEMVPIQVFVVPKRRHRSYYLGFNVLAFRDVSIEAVTIFISIEDALHFPLGMNYYAIFR